MREKIPALPSSREREKLQPVRLTNDARFNFVCWIVAPIHQCRRRFPPQKTGGSCIRSLSLVINDHSFVSQLLSLRREMAEPGGIINRNVGVARLLRIMEKGISACEYDFRLILRTTSKHGFFSTNRRYRNF